MSFTPHSHSGGMNINNNLQAKSVKNFGMRIPNVFTSRQKTPRNTLNVMKMSDDPGQEKTTKKIESKYLLAGIVTLLALVFDFFRMHSGIPFWKEGGRL